MLAASPEVSPQTFIPPTKAPFAGPDARVFFAARGIPVNHLAKSKLRGAGACLKVLPGGAYREVCLSKEFAPDSERGQWMLWHEAAHVVDGVEVLFSGFNFGGRRHQFRASTYAEDFAALLTTLERDQITRFTPVAVALRLSLRDGTKALYHREAEIEADPTIPEARKGGLLYKMRAARHAQTRYKEDQTEVFAEAAACYILRPDFFKALFPKAAAFLAPLFP